MKKEGEKRSVNEGKKGEKRVIGKKWALPGIESMTEV